jgi:hypothetical protein
VNSYLSDHSTGTIKCFIISASIFTEILKEHMENPYVFMKFIEKQKFDLIDAIFVISSIHMEGPGSSFHEYGICANYCACWKRLIDEMTYSVERLSMNKILFLEINMRYDSFQKQIDSSSVLRL